MKPINFCIIIFLCIGFQSFAQKPLSHPDATWEINDAFTDEFNTPNIDPNIWSTDIGSWATWSWDEDNSYITSDSVLTLRMRHQNHSRGGKDLNFMSGITRSNEKITYGYFETRLKATDKGQGTCPAFWLYSVGEPTPTEEGGVKYCEIDVIEIFQKPYDEQRLEMNLHTRIIENGQLVWKRPGQGHTDLTANTWLAPWHPSDDFHTYGVLNRLDSIFWYVDGVQRGAKKNHYWHLPMYMTASLGLRTPYEEYINGTRRAVPTPDPEPGFPTEAYFDYIRTWTAEADLYAESENYKNAEFMVDSDLEFRCRYFAGTGEAVLVDDWKGVSCILQELDANGAVVNELVKFYPNAIAKESGEAKIVLPLDGYTPSAMLPTGHQYVLRPVFKTSANGGEDIYMKDEFFPITLIENTSSVNSFEAKENINIFNASEGVFVNLSENLNDGQLRIHDLSGKELYSNKISSGSTLIENATFPTSGVYMISVKTGDLERVEKVVIMGN